MKTKQILVALFAVILSGCAEDVERLARPHLERAQQAYANKQYGFAKLQLDSIKLLYPKAIETHKQAHNLLVQVELDAALADKQYVDSLLADTREKIATEAAKLYLDKNPEYQDVGYYYASHHCVEQNVGRTYLRPQVSERGECSIVVFHRGRGIQAHTLRFTASDDTFIELKAQSEPYATSDALGRTERTDYVVSADVGIASFVAQCKSLPRVTLVGQNGSVSIPFSKHEAGALEQVCGLASLLRLMTELELQQSELNRRIEFFSNRVS